MGNPLRYELEILIHVLISPFVVCV